VSGGELVTLVDRLRMPLTETEWCAFKRNRYGLSDRLIQGRDHRQALNLLRELRRSGKIESRSTRTKPMWMLVEPISDWASS